MSTPEITVQRQFDAFNAHDVDALLATYAPDARQFEHPGTLLASGAAQIRERMAARFQDPLLKARLLQRVVMGNLVIDHEQLTRTAPAGPGLVEVVAIYEIVGGLIQSSSVYASKPAA